MIGSPLKFFLLVFVLSVPFWLIGAVTGSQILPGLPVSALMGICPAAAAAILVYRESRSEGVSRLLKRALDFGRIRPGAWYLPTLFLMPGLTLLSYVLMRLMSLPLPAPAVSVWAALGLFVLFLLEGAGEELGWSGYVLDPMLTRGSALQAAALIGAVWAVWHLIPLVQAHRSSGWIAWWCLYTIGQRVLMVWLYNNAGRSVSATILFHDTANVSWQTFPNQGSHWDPRISGLIVAGAAAVVTLLWGPRTLVRRSIA